MAFPCNIDRRGRHARFWLGLAATVAGAVLTLGWGVPSWARVVGVLIVLGGAFGMFEAAVGWCAIRALGFKTRV